jgi:hypothetical protein
MHLEEVCPSSSLLGFPPPLATSYYPHFLYHFQFAFSSLPLFYLLFFYIPFILFSSYFKLSSSFVSYSYFLFLLQCSEPHSYAFKIWKGNILCVCGGGGLLGKKLFEEFYCCPLPYLVIATLRDHYVDITNVLKSVRSLILSRVGVTIDLDWMIGFTAPDKFTTRDYT